MRTQQKYNCHRCFLQNGRLRANSLCSCDFYDRDQGPARRTDGLPVSCLSRGRAEPLLRLSISRLSCRLNRLIEPAEMVPTANFPPGILLHPRFPSAGDGCERRMQIADDRHPGKNIDSREQDFWAGSVEWFVAAFGRVEQTCLSCVCPLLLLGKPDRNMRETGRFSMDAGGPAK